MVLVSTIFAGLAVVFIMLSLHDYLTGVGKSNIKRKTWLLIALIFTAVSIGLSAINLFS